MFVEEGTQKELRLVMVIWETFQEVTGSYRKLA
jgi:hypothetical protein